MQLVRVQTGAPVWAGHFDDDLLAIEDSISRQVAEELTPQLTGEERERMARGGASSREAHDAYLRGRALWSQHSGETLAQALMAFMEAIAAGPNYADCYLQLGVWGGLHPAESFAAAKESARKALDIDAGLAEAQASAGFATWALERDLDAAAHSFQVAIILNPDYAEAHCWLGLLEFSRGRHETALVSVGRARKLDPTSHTFAASLALVHYNARKDAKAIELLEAFIPDSPPRQRSRKFWHRIIWRMAIARRRSRLRNARWSWSRLTCSP